MRNEKTFILANCILLVIFVFKLLGLHHDVQGDVRQEPDLFEPVFGDMTRSSDNIVLSEYRNIFGVKALQEEASNKAPLETTRPFTEDEVTELLTEHEVIRLKGTFITETDKYAAVVIVDKGSGREKELIKAKEGDKVRNFAVDVIMPGFVVLSAGPSENVRLKVFEPM